MYKLFILYSWGDEEQPINCESLDQVWRYAMQLAIKEAECAGSEHECEIGLSFNKETTKDYDRQISLHYTYDDTYCYYRIKKERG